MGELDTSPKTRVREILEGYFIEETFQMNDKYGRHGADAQLFVGIRLLFTICAHPRVLVGELFALRKQLKTIIERGYILVLLCRVCLI
jgi:hypothetical protein